MTEHEHSPGYLIETTYPDRFYRELSPVWLNYVATLGAGQPRMLDGHFTYLELGCGFGQSTIANAGAFPNAEFYACDINPAHIEAAVHHAARLGIGNVKFYESSFEDLLAKVELPSFDFIVLHGIYSWVGSTARASIQQIVARKLKTGGLLYLSYNCLPGWSTEAPLRKLMQELADAEAGDIEQRTRHALTTLQQLSANNFRYFRDNPATVRAVEAFTRDPANYLAHEFLNDTWKLYYSIDVADDMARAGATYLGSATLADNHPMLLVDQASAESVAKLPTARLRQLAMDFAVNQRFRRDVFVGGGPTKLTQAEIIQNLDNAIIGCVCAVDQISAQATIPRGKISFQEEFVSELRLLMGNGAVSIGDAVTALGDADRNLVEIKQNLVFLVAAGTLSPFAQASAQPAHITPKRTANTIVDNALKNIARTGNPEVVPCERLGSGVLVQAQEALAVQAWLARTEHDRLPPSRLVRLGLLT